MTVARAIATMLVAMTCAQTPAPRSDAPPAATEILARAKAVFRAHVRPPFVVYRLVRRDEHLGEFDLENSYALKIWCRAADRSALVRRTWKGVGEGPLDNITVAFDGMVDPGPPDADIFERALFAPKPAAPPTPEPADSPLPVIGGVVVATDYDYRVTRTAREGDLWHLWLEPRRDPARNRVDELWVDAASYEISRARVRDHLYIDGGFGRTLDEEFDVRFALRDGLPLITRIHGETAGGEFAVDYTFDEVTFPAVLPAWYFTPALYGLHRSEAPG